MINPAYRIQTRSLVVLLLLLLTAAMSGRGADAFDGMRAQWQTYLSGGTNYDPEEPGIKHYLEMVADAANSQWAKLNTATNRTYLWPDLTSSSRSTEMTSAYKRIYAMALGYATWGGILYTNEALGQEVLRALDWMYANRYNEKKSVSDNWWDWEIGTPMALNDICTLMYERLSATQFQNFMNAVNKFSPTPTKTGANLMWKIRVCAIRGVLVKDGAKLILCRDAFSKLFPYVTSGDGFYADGSFIQHEKHPYTGGYGASLLDSLPPVLRLLQGTTWSVTDPKQTNVLAWAFNAYLPVLNRGAMMDMVRGREISRVQGGRVIGHGVIGGLFQLSDYASPEDGLRLKSLLKYEASRDASSDWTDVGTLDVFKRFGSMLADPNVEIAAERVFHKPFRSMDCVVHSRRDFALAIRMHSSRIYNYEVVNNENIHGWFTGDGMLYLYNDDLDQYTDAFWPTVNPYRMPGTTVDTNKRSDSSGQSSTSGKKWVGGSVLDNTYGVTGMELKAYNSTLVARKSWFCFDDEVVCLGAGITGGTKAIETIVENRKIAGTNSFVADGVAMPTDLGWSNQFGGLTWCALEGSGGYYFPAPTKVKAIREARTGSWRDINQNRGTTNLLTRNYLTLWMDHGVKPSKASYAYALLPNKNASEVEAYASAPHFTIVENSPGAQAVLETNLNILAVNFWNAETKQSGYITSSTISSVIARETPKGLSLGVSDPTQAGSSVTLTLARSAVAAVYLDPGVTVKRLTPTIQITVNTSKKAGQTLRAVFAYTTNSTSIAAATPREYTELSAAIEDGVEAEASGNLPQLTVQQDASDMVLSWPAGEQQLQVYTATGLVAPVQWRPVTNTPSLNEGEWRMVVPVERVGQRFYRLQAR